MTLIIAALSAITALGGHTAPPAAVGTVLVGGTIWQADRSHGSAYLAVPLGKGHRVRICGEASCRVMTSTDAGPAKFRQREGRVADVAVVVWLELCGKPEGAGWCKGSVEYLDTASGPVPTPPATDTAP